MVDSPAVPFLRLNTHHIARFHLSTPDGRAIFKSCFEKMRKPYFESARFKEGAVIIDAECRKFPIRDVVSQGSSRDFWDILTRQNFLKVKYIYGTPIQLSFDQAREEVVELIVRKRWYSKTQDRESEKQFRERMSLCENMHDLIIGKPNTDPQTSKRYQWIGGISFYGEWVG